MLSPSVGISNNDKIIEGRRRLLTCLAKKGAESKEVGLRELQQQYIEDYEEPLTKEVLRHFFNKTHITRVFDIYMTKDVEMQTNIENTGSLNLRMIRPLKAALANPPVDPSISADKNPHYVEKVEKKASRNPNLVPLRNANLVPLGKPRSKFDSSHLDMNGPNKLKESGKMESKTEMRAKRKATTTKVQQPAAEEWKEDAQKNDEWSVHEKEGWKMEDEKEKEEVVPPLSVQPKKQLSAAEGLYSDSECDENEVDMQLEANNRFLKEAQKKKPEVSIGIRMHSHAGKYIEEVKKQREQAKEETESHEPVHLERKKLGKKQFDCIFDEKTEQRVSSQAMEDQEDIGLEYVPAQKAKLAKYNQRKAMMEEREKLKDTVGKKTPGNAVEHVQYSDEETVAEEGSEEDVEETVAEEEWDEEEEDEMDEEEEEPDEAEMVLSGPNQVEKKKEMTNDKAKSSSPEMIYADQIYGKGITTSYDNRPMPGASIALAEVMPVDVRYELIALLSVLVSIEEVIKVEELHAKLAGRAVYSRFVKSVEQLMDFLEHHCPTVRIQPVGKQVFVYSQDKSENVDLVHLMRKLGKTIKCATAQQ